MCYRGIARNVYAIINPFIAESRILMLCLIEVSIVEGIVFKSIFIWLYGLQVSRIVERLLCNVLWHDACFKRHVF